MSVYNKISSHRAGMLEIPTSFAPAMGDFIDRLLHHDPEWETAAITRRNFLDRSSAAYVQYNARFNDVSAGGAVGAGAAGALGVGVGVEGSVVTGTKNSSSNTGAASATPRTTS